MGTIERHVTREVVALDAGAPCAEAARLMTKEQIGSIAVREGGRIIGLVTERDLVAQVLSAGATADLPIRKAMRTDLPTVTPSTSDATCSALMRDHVTRHLLVKDGGEVIGIVSMRDVIRLMLEEKEWLIDQLHTFIHGHDGPRAQAG
jgi:CBS domain-containing protein